VDAARGRSNLAAGRSIAATRPISGEDRADARYSGAGHMVRHPGLTADTCAFGGSSLTMNNFDLRLLYVFEVLYEEKNVTRAATRLHLTQSAISHALARLRVMLDDPLFVRVPSGLLPTDRAHDLAPRLRIALAEVRSLVTPYIFHPISSDRHFTISASGSYFRTTIARLVALVRNAAPGISVQVLNRGPHITQALDQQQVDIVLGAFSKVPRRFRSEVLFRDQLVWVCRAHHPLAEKFDTDKAMLAQPRIGTASEFVSQRPRTELDEIVRHPTLGSDETIDLNISGETKAQMIVADSATVMEVVTSTDMVALLPRRYIRAHPSSAAVKILKRAAGKAETMEVAMLWHSRMTDDSGLKWLRTMIRRAIEISANDTPASGT
jgi:DNA-binding transcriptional LysR family regulator